MVQPNQETNYLANHNINHLIILEQITEALFSAMLTQEHETK